MAEIVLEGIGKRFPDGTEALRRTDLAIEDGELFIVVGPSGCGKSTLLNIIVGLEQPTSGALRVDGRPVTDLDPKDRNMAMVFQSYAIYPHMTVRENMAFPLRMAGLDGGEIERRVREAADSLELGDLLERRPSTLSGGQRQRVAMGRAIVRQPAAFLLDEPLSNLDAKLRVQMRAELARLQKRLGTTTVYVTHDQTEAMTLGDRIALLNRGQVQQVGRPRDLYERPANLFVAAFIGLPAMSFVPAKVRAQKLVLPMVELPLPNRFEGRLGDHEGGLIVGVRPEHVHRANGSADGTIASFEAEVDMVEWLGADLYVYFDLPVGPEHELSALQDELEVVRPQSGRLRMAARVDGATDVVAGQSMHLRIDTDRMSLFDANTGKRLPANDE